MNRWLDGTTLTASDMEQIALDHGLLTAEEVVNKKAGLQKMYSSFINSLTQKTRFEMFTRGELKLDTRTERNRPKR